MAKSTAAELKELRSRFQHQAQELSTLRTAIDTQFKRIAQIQGELDLLPHARRRRKALVRAMWNEPSSHNGDQRSHG